MNQALCGRVTYYPKNVNPLNEVHGRIVGGDGDAFIPPNKADIYATRCGFPGIIELSQAMKARELVDKKFFATSFCSFLLATVISEQEGRDHNRVLRS